MLAKLPKLMRKLQQYSHSYNVYITLLVSPVVEPEKNNLEPLLVQYQSADNDNLQIANSAARNSDPFTSQHFSNTVCSDPFKDRHFGTNSDPCSDQYFGTNSDPNSDPYSDQYTAKVLLNNYILCRQFSEMLQQSAE